MQKSLINKHIAAFMLAFAASPIQDFPRLLGAGAGESGCNDCTPDTVIEPVPVEAINTLNTSAKSQKGGYKGFLLIKCNVPLPEFTQEAIQALIASGDAVIRKDCNLIKGTRSTDKETEKLGDCAVEKVTNRTHSITLTDYGSDLEDCSEDDLYTFLQANDDKFIVFLITCNNKVEGGCKATLDPEFQNEGGDGYAFWNLTVTWESLINEKRMLWSFWDQLTSN